MVFNVTKPALILSSVSKLPLWLFFILSKGRSNELALHAHAALDWLIHSSKVTSKHGFAHSLHFARGWLPGYPETTGYIIPTLLLAARHYGRPDAERAAMDAWQWLCNTQQADGAFVDLSGKPQVFDTGQILIGANFLCRMGDTQAPDIARRAAEWLIRQQSEDGSFIAHAYNDQPHAYYSRVGAALLETGQILDLPAAKTAGLRNLEWTLNQQESDGWFGHMSFAAHPPFSHTIVYTLEGLLAGFRLTEDIRMFDAVIRCSTALQSSINKHGGIIKSQYNKEFVPIDEQICVTGLCQWAAHCFRLNRLDACTFLLEANRSLEAAKRLQIHSLLPTLNGSLPGSVPLSGRYMRFSLPNWGVKFFLDALLEAESDELAILL